MEINRKELNLNEMEMVNGGFDLFGRLAKVTVGMVNAVNNIGDTLCQMAESLFCGDD